MRKFIFLPLILFASAYLHGQKIELNNSVANYITKATPQALLFQKYGDIPVNTSTGIASVTVDMFEVKIKGVNWKIGLSYHSGGIKVNDISGSAGLGWSLNAIGMISSRMYQGCDAIVNLEGDVLANRRNYNLSVSTNPLGVCNYPNPTDIGYARNLIEMKGFADYTSFNYIPDIFYLNAGTLSGKFFIKKKKGYCMPARDLKIEVFNTPINFILVTDEAGNKYTFEQKGSNSQMVTNNNFEIEGAGGSGDPLTENPNFMLTKIENPFGEKIEFNYVIESYTYRGPDSDFYTDYPTQPANAPCTPGNDGFGINQRTWNHVEEARLESIITSTGEKVVFTYSARADIAGASKLDKVTLYSVLLLQDKYVKAYRLYNSYFSTGSTAREKRLRLDSVVQENGLNQTLPGYEFTYNPINLPSRISAAQDTSGYYNGKPNGTNLVPVYGADRSYSIEHAKACVLEKVVYPTGGETRFEYEMKATGGLRIKRLKNYSLGTLSGTKSYEYFDPVGGPGKTFQKDITTYEYYCNGPRPKVEATCSKKVTYSSPMEPLYYSYYGETTERYGRVIEYDEYNGSNGKREFKYGNAGIPSRNGLMGIEDLLYEKNIYRKISSGYELAIKQVNKYYYQTEPNNQTIYLQDSMATGEIRVFGIDFESIKDEFSSNAMECDGPATWSTCYPAMYLSFFYRLVSSPIAIAEEINYSYEGSNVLEHKKQYTYDPANLMAPITITEILSDGSKQTDSLRYPSTYSNITATDALTTGIRNLRDKHVIIPIEKASYQFLPNGTLDRLLYSQFTSFRSDMPLPDTLFILQSVTPLLNYNLSNTISGAVKKDARYTPRITFGKYDGKGNLTEQQFINDLKNSYIWDFNSSLPIATAKNAGADDIAYASFEYDGAGNWIRNGGTLNTSIARTGIRSLTLTSGNTLVKNSLSAANTYSVTYWSRNGSMSANNGSGNLLMTKQGWGLYEHIISGASTITVSGSGVIDDLVLRPVNSDMNIYTFEPLVGIVSQAGVRNMITHYEYDNFRRLIHIRDLDSNILKKISYQTRQIADPTGIWTPTGNTKCKPCDLDPTFLSNILLREERNTNSSSPTYNWLQWVEAGTSPTCVNVAVWQNTATPLRCETPNTGYQEQEQIDINPCSPTFNTLRWAHQNLNCTLCPKPANWQWTGNFRCQKDGTNQNTGIREREYRDVESCGSPTYNQLKWMVYETNLTACPVSGCNNNNCYSPSQKCINNVCTNGIRVNISSYYDSGSGMWQCNYRYEFSDGTYSETLTEYNADPCDI